MTNLKTPGIVDRSLDSQDRALLVVHLDRVLIKPVLDSQALAALEVAGANLSAKPTISASPQKTQYVLAAELLNSMPAEPPINPLKGSRILEHHICGVLTLPDAPVVSMQIQSARRPDKRIYTLCQRVE